MELAYLLLLKVIPVEIIVLSDILRHKYVYQTINFNCNNEATEIAIHKYFSIIGLRSISSKLENSTQRIPFHYPKIGIIVNTSCPNWQSAFENINATHAFKSPFNWFVISEDLSPLDYISQYPIEIDSDVTVISKAGQNVYNLHEVYNTGFYSNGTFKITKIGHWNTSLHIDIKRRMDLSGIELKAVVVITQKVANETFEEYVERGRTNKADTLHKQKYFTLLKYLRDMYNFSFVLRRTTSWGYQRNGSFDGMIGALQRREADIGASPCFLRLERAKVLDATMELWNSRPLFILRHPKHPGGYYAIFTRPLTNTVWYSFIAVLAIAGLVLCAMINVGVLKVAEDSKDNSLSLAVLTILGAVCQQGTTLARNSTAINLVIFVTFLFALTIYQYYNAVVVSTLLRDPPKNIRTSADLLRSNLRAGAHDVLYNKDFFRRTTDPIALQLYSKKIATQKEYNFYQLEHGMAMVKSGGFAFLVDSTLAYGIMRATFNEAELCDAHEISLYPPQNIVSVVKKGSPYKETITYGLRRMFEVGLPSRIKSLWDEPRPSCVRTPDTGLITVSLREFSTPLILLGIGALVSASLLFVEIVLHRLERSPSRKF